MEGLQERLGKIAIIGGGQMGEAIVAGLVSGALFDAEKIYVAEPFENRRELLSSQYGVTCVEEGYQLPTVETVILAVKPQVFTDVAAGLAAAESFQPKRVASIAAGVSTLVMSRYFTGCAVIRVMPNINLCVSAGMSVVAPAEDTSTSEAELIRELFSLMGEAVILDESLIDAATAVNGSGPAYYALFTEELAKSGIDAGLPEDIAWLLARQTIIGTGRYLELKDVTPADLRAAVTSPNGTTQAALDCFTAQHLDLVIRNAFAACVRRAKELG
ncbi:MAG: pyrroline-5-carboxylate reductase [Coriobacteriales bacterium]|jgi:pyrroline-5-carboxylate reductase|nr:pyrroline-5-carboxylate reductase [Coriobacteriales bacterium]